jgi:hypothetical protein
MSIISVMPWPIVDIANDDDDRKPDENCKAQCGDHDEETSNRPDLFGYHNLRISLVVLKALNILHSRIGDSGFHIVENV